MIPESRKFVEETRISEKREEINQRNRKKKRYFVLIAAGIAVIVLILVGVQATMTGRLNNYKIVAEFPRAGNQTGYRMGNDVFMLYSNDGAKAIAADGSLKWEMSYLLDNPAIEYCNEVVAVADIGGNTVCVVAENGIPYQYNVVYPIVKHAVAKQGVTAVLLDNGTEDYIQLYDIRGELRVDINTKTKTDGIPVDIALSEDGKRLVTLYASFDGNFIYGKVTFYNAGEVGKNYIGNVVGQKIFEENVLVYDVGFLEDDLVYVLHEKGFVFYRMKETPELLWELTIENEIVDIAIAEKSLYVVERTPEGKNILRQYQPDTGLFSGRVVDTWDSIPEYEKLFVTEEEVIFFSPQKLLIYRNNKSLKYEEEFPGGLEAVYPIGGNRYFLVREGSVQSINLTNGKQKEGE